jgi:hypothetical protein
MATTSPNDELNRQNTRPNDDDMRAMTGIGADEEGAMDREADRGIGDRSSPALDELRANEAAGIGRDAARTPNGDLRNSDNLDKVDPWLAQQQRKGLKQAAKNTKTAMAIPQEDGRKGGFFNKSDTGNGRLKKGKGKLKQLSKNKTLLFGGSGVGILLIGIILLIVFVGSLKLPDLMEGIESYEFAAVGQQFSKTTDSVTIEDLDVEDASDGVFSQLKDRYQNLRDNTWGKLDAYRPDKVIESLGENDGLKINTKTSVFGTRVTSVEIRGNLYEMEPITGIAKWTPGLNQLAYAKNKLSFQNSGFMDDINFSMKSNGTSDIVRSATMLKVLKLTDGTFYGWVLSKFGDPADGEAPSTPVLDAVATKEQAESAEAGEEEPDDAVMTETSQADAKAKTQLDEDTQNVSDLEDNDTDGGWLSNVLTAANSALNPDLLTKILHITGFIYLIIAPLCIAFDGSVQHSQSSIDNNSNMLMDSFDQLSAEADQQKQGDIDPNDGGELANAVAATNDEIGDISATNDIPYQRAYGHVQSTVLIPGAETGSDGGYDYSLLDSLGGIPANSVEGKTANALAIHFCGLLTSTYTSAGLTVAQIILSIVSFGATDAGAEAASDGISTFITKYVTQLFAEQEVKDAAGAVIDTVTWGARARRFAGIQAGLLGATTGLAVLAHMEVSERSGEADSGLAQDSDLSNQADEGGELEANDVMRMAMFGRPMLESEVAASQEASLTQVDYVNSQKNFTDRYFALSNYDSLLTHLGMDLGASDRATDIASLVRLGGSILRPVNSLASLIGSISGAAYAAPAPSILDYGDVQFGWPASEEDVIKSSNSYYMLENQQILDQSGNEDAIAQQFAPCFGYKYNSGGDGNLNPDDPNGDLQLDPTATVGYLLSNDDIWRDNTTGDVINSPDGSGLCDPDRLSYANTQDAIAADKQSPEADGGSSPQANDMIFRWRLAMEYLTTVDQLSKEQLISDTDNTTGSSTTQAAYDNNDGGFYQPPDTSASDYALNPSTIKTVAKKSHARITAGMVLSR